MKPQPRPVPSEPPHRRELRNFALYRLLESALFALLAFAPYGAHLGELRYPVLAKSAAVLYSVAALTLMWMSRRSGMRVRRQAALGLCLDLLVAGMALYVQEGAENAISLMLLFNIGAGGLILTAHASLGFAGLAGSVVVGQYLSSHLLNVGAARPIAEAAMFAVTYLAAAALFHLLSRQMSQSQALAEKRGEELASLSELNELVIRRMRTGVLVVDGSHRIRLSNEAAWALLGNVSPNHRDLAKVAPALHESLWHWRQGHGEVPPAMTFAEGGPEVLPRFVPLSLTSALFLIFLDDSRVYSGRAEELTLSILGRLSASIAHQIRNPLAAISYSTQLLEESLVLPDTDRRLLEIIHSQCQRMDGIVHSILGLARRAHSQPESLELKTFARRFVEEYRSNQPLETDVLEVVTDGRPLVAVVDPQHLHQVLTVLVQNALTYGRIPGTPVHVRVVLRKDEPDGPPLLEVIDRGPGIPPAVAAQIFDPFYTTSEYGTGLGLYIARQLCEANLCALSFEPLPGGGSCFRVSLPVSQNLVQPEMRSTAGTL